MEDPCLRVPTPEIEWTNIVAAATPALPDVSDPAAVASWVRGYFRADWGRDLDFYHEGPYARLTEDAIASGSFASLEALWAGIRCHDILGAGSDYNRDLLMAAGSGDIAMFRHVLWHWRNVYSEKGEWDDLFEDVVVAARASKNEALCAWIEANAGALRYSLEHPWTSSSSSDSA